jgi:hypothetical protein
MNFSSEMEVDKALFYSNNDRVRTSDRNISCKLKTEESDMNRLNKKIKFS